MNLVTLPGAWHSAPPESDGDAGPIGDGLLFYKRRQSPRERTTLRPASGVAARLHTCGLRPLNSWFTASITLVPSQMRVMILASISWFSAAR